MAVPMKTTNGNRKLILNVDTGIDDALALAYLASFNNIEILGVIGTYGNVSADTAVDVLHMTCVSSVRDINILRETFDIHKNCS